MTGGTGKEVGEEGGRGGRWGVGPTTDTEREGHWGGWGWGSKSAGLKVVEWTCDQWEGGCGVDV